MYYVGTKLNVYIAKVRNLNVGIDSSTSQYQVTLRMKAYDFMLWFFHCPDDMGFSLSPGSLRNMPNPFYLISFCLFSLPLQEQPLKKC